MTDITMWRKSSFSGGGANDCIEVNRQRKHTGIRDSKAPTVGILVNAEAFDDFLEALKSAP
jgi:hypothetical protein